MSLCLPCVGMEASSTYSQWPLCVTTSSTLTCPSVRSSLTLSERDPCREGSALVSASHLVVNRKGECVRLGGTDRHSGCDTVWTGKRPFSVEHGRCPVQSLRSSLKVIRTFILRWNTQWHYRREVAGSIPDGVIIVFHWHSPSGRTVAPGVDSASTRNENWQYFLWGKDGRCVKLTTLPSSCAVSKSGALNLLEPSRPVQGYNRTDLPLPLTLYWFGKVCQNLRVNSPIRTASCNKRY